MCARVFAGFHDNLATYAGPGNILIAEHVLNTPGWHADPGNMPARFDILFVGVNCPAAVLFGR